MSRRTMALALALCVSLGLVLAGEPAGVPGRLDAVTVYRDQAAVTRLVPVPEGGGTMEIVVTELPEHIDRESLHADAGEGVQIRAVRFRERVAREQPKAPPQEALDKLDEQMKPIETSLRELQQARDLVKTKHALLEKLAATYMTGAGEEMKKGFVETDQLSKFTLFVFEQHDALAARLLELTQQEQKLNEQLTALRKQRAELIPTPGAARTVREAIVLIEKEQQGRAQIRFGYLVTAVGWTPGYNLRVREGQPDIELEYHATVQQASGEDWTNAKLTLSTATPTLSSEAPRLAPYRVMLDEPTDAEGAHELARLERERRAAEDQFRAADTDETRHEAEAAANAAAARKNVLFLRGLPESAAPLDPRRHAAPALPVSYELPGRQSLASRDDLQTLRIASVKLRGDFYRLAQPAITRYVYRQAQLTNTSKMTLLAGRANAYVDGRFAGAGTLPQVRPGQRFTAGFGMDPRLTARHDLLARQEELKGGNKELALTYNIRLENFSDTPLAVRVLDRYPAPAKGRIYVAFLDAKPALSDDADYVKRLKPHHLLRWDVNVPARATDDKALVIEYGFRVGFAKDLQIHAGRTITPLFALVRPLEPWKVETDWSGDETKLAVAHGKPGEPERLSLTLARGSARKNVIGRRVEGDLSGYRWLVVDLENKISAGTRLAIALSTGAKWAYFESTPNYVKKGENPNVVFDLTAPNYKSERKRWEYSDKVTGLARTRAVYLVFYPAASGTVVVRGIKLAK